MQEQERFNILRENLKDLMSHRGYSSTRLAKECKTSEGKSCFTTSTITRFLKDPKATLRAGTIKELADFFNVPVDALFNKNVLQFCTELEKKPESVTLIPLVTNDGALAICGYPSRWPNFPEIDPVCELLAMVPSPPLSPQKGFDFSKLFAQQISDSLMEPDFLSGDIVYLAPPTPGTKLDGKFALVLSLIHIFLGPLRKQTQVEISATDTFVLKVHPPVRPSGDIEGTPGLTIVGPKGVVKLEKGCIIANRHIHMSPADAARFGVKDGEYVNVLAEGERRTMMYGVQIRVDPSFTLEMHIDTDDANAIGFKEKVVTLLKREDCPR